jgi:hypothetical protein
MLWPTPRERATQPPRCVEFINDKLNKLQMLWIAQVRFGEHSFQLGFRGCAVEGL